MGYIGMYSVVGLGMIAPTMENQTTRHGVLQPGLMKGKDARASMTIVPIM